MDSLRPPQMFYPAEIFTNTFKIEGEIEPFGRLIDFLNDKTINYVLVHDVTMTPLAADNPMGTMSLEEINLDTRDVLFLYLKAEEDRSEIRLLPNSERIIAYFPLFVIRAIFHFGGEIRVRDMLDTMTSIFVPITEAGIFPTFSSKASIPSTRELLIVNKDHIHTYHVESPQ